MNTQVLNVSNYNVYVGQVILFDQLSSCLDKDYLLIIDKNVYELYTDYLSDLVYSSIDYFIIEALESNKTETTLNQLYDLFYENHITRESHVIVIGGGLILDIVGYACATYNRGIHYISVPTTLLSMVDSSIGGKVAINKYDIKNIIGSFYNPSKVIIDLNFLNTLTTRLFKAGFVELLKHGFIKDASIIQDLSSYPDIQSIRNNLEFMQGIILKSLKVKQYYVENDFKDKGIRNTLNFGHTFAHALEMSHSNYLHGECVAIGMLVASCLTNQEDKVLSILDKYQLVRPLVKVDFRKIDYDKKKSNDSIKEIVLDDIGSSRIIDYKVDVLIECYLQIYSDLQDKISTYKPIYQIQNNLLKGSVTIPPSKSYLHRYILLAFLHGRMVRLNNVYSLNEDVLVTMKALEAFNVLFKYEYNVLSIDASSIKYVEDLEINLKESGTSLRLLLPLLNYFAREVTYYGENKLASRPLKEYLDLFDDLDVLYNIEGINGDNLPITIYSKVDASFFEIDGSRSSQFISGILILMSILDHHSTLKITGGITSLPYIKLTLKALQDYGIEIEVNEDYTLYTCNHHYTRVIHDLSFDIEQDYSSRAFFEVGNALGNEVAITNEVSPSLQEDASIIDTINNKETTFDLLDKPDCGPIMALYQAFNGGSLTNVHRLLYKESNRLQAICDFLDKLGVTYLLNKDTLTIDKVSIFKGGYYDTYLDHRISMTLLILATIADSPIYLDEIQSINKSYPDFIKDYKKLGGVIDEL